MSAKAIIGLALVAVAIAAPFAIPGILGVAAGSFAAIAATAAIEVGIALTQTILLGPSIPKLPQSQANGGRDRLYVSLDVTTPRKIVLGGPTAMATDLRYQTYSGTDQDTYWQVIAVASHEVNAISEIWLDNEQAWTSGGGVLGRYVGYLTVTTRTLGTNANGVAIDSVWTSSCTLTGCAYIVLSYKLTGASDSEDSPFAGGVTNRMTIRGKGAKVYDPRLDSTVTGGSGTQRAATQSTWAWNDNASRNPALQLLWYLLGWDINSKLAVGMGIPPARIDLPSFITAANICDESITLNGGGTEPRYRTDGVLSEGDDRKAVIDALCSQMNAMLRDAGGKLSLTVMKNDLASPIASFTENDMLGDEEWTQTPTFRHVQHRPRPAHRPVRQRALPADRFPRGQPDQRRRHRSHRHGRLYAHPIERAGGAPRQAAARAQPVPGPLFCLGGPRWWQVTIGDVVQLSHQGLGWSNKLFRLVGQTISRTGQTKVVLLEENAAIYAWDNSEAAPVTPARRRSTTRPIRRS
jgi:hypothetical protein